MRRGRGLYYATAALLGPVWVIAIVAIASDRLKIGGNPEVVTWTTWVPIVVLVAMVASLALVAVAFAFRRAITASGLFNLVLHSLLLPAIVVAFGSWLVLVPFSASLVPEKGLFVTFFGYSGAVVLVVEILSLGLVHPLAAASFVLLRWSRGSAEVPPTASAIAAVHTSNVESHGTPPPREVVDLVVPSP